MATIFTVEPSSSNPNPNQTLDDNHQSQPPFIWPPDSSFKPSNHRRAFSDVSCHIPGHVSDVRANDIVSDEDIFSKYIDFDKYCNAGEEEDKKSNDKHVSLPTNRRADILKYKKAMPAHKLAELWIVDPKRAKRILANRQSAARSKERKARYIVELEKRVQSLDVEATTLSTQLNIYQRDVVDLAAENAKLKLQLQTVEHQMQLRDDLTEALKREVERLSTAPGNTRQVPLNQCGTHFSYTAPSSCVAAAHHSNDAHHYHHHHDYNPLVDDNDDDDPFSWSLDFDIGTLSYITKLEPPDYQSNNTTVL